MASLPRKTKPKIRGPQKYGPEFSANNTWEALSRNIREIQNENASNLSFEENYRFAYNMVVQKEGKRLYDGVKKLVTEKLDQLAKDLIIPAFPTTDDSDPTQQSQENETLLKALRHTWDVHVSYMSKLTQILKYADRVYTKTADVPEFWDAGLDLYLTRIIRSPIQEHLITAILNQIRFERNGFVINRSAVKGCVQVFVGLETNKAGVSVYKRDLEPPVLRETTAFYEAEGVHLLETCDAPTYLKRVEDRLESEDSRTHHYLSRQTAAPIRQILLDHLLTAHLNTVIALPNSGLDVMIDSDRLEDLSRLYRLATAIPTGLPTLRRHLRDSITNRGKAINRTSLGIDTEEPGMDQKEGGSGSNQKAKPLPAAQFLALALQWVQDVLDLKDKFDAVWRKAFQCCREMESGIDEAFGTFVNMHEKSSEFISLFIDDNLRRGLKGKTDNEVETVLDKTTTVFRFIAEKDVFERYYKGHLAKRLLHGRSVSDDAERGMLAKLKVECGYQFTQKLEGMFHDMKLSADTMQAYREHLANSTPPSIDLSVTVMTSTFWPMSHSSSPCNMPSEMLKACKSFEQFYLSRHSGRRLTWQPSLGNADVRVAFKSRKHDLNVATFALVILLLFEDLKDDEFLTYEEIKNATGIVDGELQRHLQSLACAKFKVLKKHPPGREVHPDDSFSFNIDFSAPMQKIKISTVSSKVETGEERKETKDRIDEERRHQTEACIIRIMKDRKHMTHNDLTNEVTKQLSSRFQPEPLVIKKRIEGLIEREYLERCDDRKSYNYLA